MSLTMALSDFKGHFSYCSLVIITTCLQGPVHENTAHYYIIQITGKVAYIGYVTCVSQMRNCSRSLTLNSQISGNIIIVPF